MDYREEYHKMIGAKDYWKERAVKAEKENRDFSLQLKQIRESLEIVLTFFTNK